MASDGGTAMRPMTAGERQVLIDLAAEYPALQDIVRGKLVADNELRRWIETEARELQYKNWRAREVRRLERRYRRARWLGPVLSGIGVLCFLTVLRNMDGELDAEGIFGLIFYGALTLAGTGVWLEGKAPLVLPPTSEEIAVKGGGLTR